jgi:DHA1 family tetracycline resistance protein-like MFS transporter
MSDKSVAEALSSKQRVGTEKKKAGIIFLTVFLDLLGFGLIIPVMPSYALELHASDFAVGLLIASYSLMQLIFAPFWGRLSDHVGRRPILISSLAASTIGYVVWGLSGSLTMLFISRLIQGAGNANISVAQAYIADITTPENRAKGMGLIGAAFGLGFVFGPAIGGYCVSPICQNALSSCFPSFFQSGHLAGLQMIGFVAAAITLIDLVLVFFLLPEPEKRSNAATERFSLDPAFYFETLRNKKLQISLLIFFLSTFAFANMEATIILFTQRVFNFTPFENGMMFTYIGLLIVFVQGGMIHRLAKKYGEKHLIAVGTVLVGLGLLLIPFSPSVNNLVLLGIALALLAFGSGINNPSNQSLLSKLAAQENMGGILGVGQSLSTLGRILGPIVGAAAFQYLGYSSPYFIGATVMMVAFAYSFLLPGARQANL